MHRVKDYIRFVICFIGIGYMVLWPLTAHDVRIALIGTASSCDGHAVRWIAMTCRSSSWLHLTPGLDLLGLASAVCVLLRLVLRHLLRWRHTSATSISSADTLAEETPPQDAVGRIAALLRRTAPPPPPRTVQPRNHFGLRGAPD
ncbi:MAG: hypothetical protein GC182_06530 [Rhodopseudomonas sp.]|nr:hypothetical protein [Rhodopseudomonas sp.]